MKRFKDCEKAVVRILLVVVCVFMCTSTTMAHSGRTDSSGGHRDNKNKSGLGSYHYHCGGYPAHLHTGGGCPYTGGGDSEPDRIVVPPVPEPSITIEEIPDELIVGDSSGLVFTVNNASDLSSKVESDNSDIVRVNEDKTITAINEGTATITISTGEVSKAFTVSVKSVPVENIILNKENMDLQLGQEETLSATIEPNNATEKTISWACEESDLIEVSDTGVLKTKATGTATIVVTANNGVTAECKVNIFEVFPEEINVSEERFEIECGDRTQFTVKIVPENANNKKYTCEIEDEKIAVIDALGNIMAKEDGNTNLIVTTENKIERKIPILIYHIPVEKVKIDSSKMKYEFEKFVKDTIDYNQELALEVNVEPHNATYQEVTWESSNIDVIKIVDGKPQIIGTGDVTLTAHTYDEIHDSISFSVISKKTINEMSSATLIIVVAVPSGVILYKKKKKDGITDEQQDDE